MTGCSIRVIKFLDLHLDKDVIDIIDKSKIYGYDFEVYSKINWFCVTFINYEDRNKEVVIVNDRAKLIEFYNSHKDDIFISYNGRQYDTGIFKGILDGMNVGFVNDKLIKEGKKPFQVVKNAKKYPLNDYDTILKDKSLKQLEAFMGDDIRETEVDFNIDRPLTKEEIKQTLYYNHHDVIEVLRVLDYCWDDFEGDLVVAANKTVEYAEGKAPAFFGLQFNTTKTFTGVADMEGIDSTLVNTKVTLKEDAGLTGVSGTRCFAIGELNAEEGGFLSGYGSGSSNPVIWWSIGNSNTNVTSLPLWLRDNTKANKNAFGVIKEGTGTYIFTGTKNSDTGKVFLGLHVKKGRAYINTPVDDPTITALCRSEKTAMAIYEGAIGGGNGRITSEVIVDGGTLEVGCQGIGQLILDDIEGQSLKSPLTVKNGGTVEFELANATSYDKLTSNNTATFNGNKIIVKAAETFDIKDGDSFTILDAAIKPEGDTYEVEFQGFPASLPLAATEESYQSGTKTEGEGETATEVPVMGYKIVITAKGSGSGTGLEDFNVADELAVYAQNGSIVVKGAGVENVIVMNTQGQVVANTNASIIPMNTVQGMYIVKVKTIAGIVTKKVIL